MHRRAPVLDWLTQLGLVTTQRYHPFPTTSMHSPSNSAMYSLNSPALIWMHSFAENSNSFNCHLISTTYALLLSTLLAGDNYASSTYPAQWSTLFQLIQQWPNQISLPDEFTSLNKLNWNHLNISMQGAQKLAKRKSKRLLCKHVFLTWCYQFLLQYDGEDQAMI